MSKEIDSGMNMYDFNRINMGQFPYLETEEEINRAKLTLKNYIRKTLGSFYMMLNHERKDFTLFYFQNDTITEVKINTMVNDIIECMDNRNLGLLDVCLDDADAAIEVWVKDRETETVYLYILFPYDNGVIQY
jgi:hypothetical protein